MSTIVNQNKAICKMMGVNVTVFDVLFYRWKLQHHVDYDLLFNVVDFIHKIGSTPENVNHSEYKVFITKNQCLICNVDNSVHVLIQAPIKMAIFDCVAAFAELYNSNTIKH
mgnify:CR=1 FL=1